MSARITIQAADEGVVERLQALPKRMRNAGSRAVTAVTDWAGDDLADRVAANNHIPRKVVYVKKGARGGPRLFVRLPKKTKRDPEGSVWLGAQPVDADLLGVALQTDEGVLVSGYELPGAFIAQMQSGHVGIFYRSINPARHSSGRPLHWQPNLPIVSARIDIDAAGPVRQVQALIPGRMEDAVQTEMDRELGDG